VKVDAFTAGARGLRFDGLVAGPAAGEPVLLLHGFPQSAEMWRPALQTLGSTGFHAYALNQRGYSEGARPERVDAYRLEELVEDVVEVLAALGHGRAHIVGHDWGGVVAWALAATHPARVITLTSVSTPHSAALRDALRHWPQRTRMLYIPVLRTPLVPESFINAAGGRLFAAALQRTGLSAAHARRDAARLRRVGPTGPLNWYRAIAAGTFQLARTVTVPTLYIWPDHDVAFTREAAEATERHVSGPYHFLELQGASHWVPDEHWDEVADVVVDHLRNG